MVLSSIPSNQQALFHCATQTYPAFHKGSCLLCHGGECKQSCVVVVGRECRVRTHTVWAHLRRHTHTHTHTPILVSTRHTHGGARNGAEQLIGDDQLHHAVSERFTTSQCTTQMLLQGKHIVFVTWTRVSVAWSESPSFSLILIGSSPSLTLSSRSPYTASGVASSIEGLHSGIPNQSVRLLYQRTVYSLKVSGPTPLK